MYNQIVAPAQSPPETVWVSEQFTFKIRLLYDESTQSVFVNCE